MEPNLTTDPRIQPVLEELLLREPSFHHPEFGRTRRDFENLMDPAFWEIGASGRRYSRDYVIDVVVKRYENPSYQGIHSLPENTWKIEGSHCLELAPDNYLLTYTLVQGERITRRSTIWRRSADGWKVVFHQGTIVENR